MSPGRSCPLDYRYRASDIAHAPLPEGLRGLETLYVVGGLYGNPEALAAVLAAFEAEPGGRRKALVFNGDFHWFDAEPDGFATVQAAVMRHWATRGNVETELAREQIGAAGCGCAYPDFVDSATVAHSNRIIERLHAAVPAGQRAVLVALPPFLRAEVAGMAVGIVHGDAESLAGWGFSQEAFKAPEAVAAAGRACEDARVAVFASSHSCLPVLQGLGGGRWLANNGAAGMPNVAGQDFGLLTRLSRQPARDALVQVRSGALHLALCPIRFDPEAWWRRFESLWPPGSAAHDSYATRIRAGVAYPRGQILRPAPPGAT